jgi:hypothetical protein
MEPRPEFNPTVGSFPFTEQDWDQTPPAVQGYVSTLHDEMSQLHEQVARLQARLNQDSTTSSRPPSSERRENQTCRRHIPIRERFSRLPGRHKGGDGEIRRGSAPDEP